MPQIARFSFSLRESSFHFRSCRGYGRGSYGRGGKGAPELTAKLCFFEISGGFWRPFESEPRSLPLLRSCGRPRVQRRPQPIHPRDETAHEAMLVVQLSCAHTVSKLTPAPEYSSASADLVPSAVAGRKGKGKGKGKGKRNQAGPPGFFPACLKRADPARGRL